MIVQIVSGLVSFLFTLPDLSIFHYCYVQQGFDVRHSSRAVFLQDFSIKGENSVATARQRQREPEHVATIRKKFVYPEYLEMSSLYKFFLSTAVVSLGSVCLLGTLRPIRTITKM